MTETKAVCQHTEFCHFLGYRLVVLSFKSISVMIMPIDDVMEELTVSSSKRNPPELKTENHSFIKQKIKQEQIILSPAILVFLN